MSLSIKSLTWSHCAFEASCRDEKATKNKTNLHPALLAGTHFPAAPTPSVQASCFLLTPAVQQAPVVARSSMAAALTRLVARRVMKEAENFILRMNN